MATIKDFEERYDVTFVDGVLFVDLFKDNRIPNKYYITRDFNFIERFFTDSDEDAKEHLFPKRDEIIKKEDY